MLIISYFLTSNARGTARVGGRRATWKNPALSFRVIGQVEPTLSGGNSLSRRRAMHASHSSVTSGGHEEAELPTYSAVPAGWLCSRLSLHRHGTHLTYWFSCPLFPSFHFRSQYFCVLSCLGSFLLLFYWVSPSSSSLLFLLWLSLLLLLLLFPLLLLLITSSLSGVAIVVGPSALFSSSSSLRCSGTRWASLGLRLGGRPVYPSSCVDLLSGGSPGCGAPPISRRALLLFCSFIWSTFLVNWRKWGYTSFVTNSHWPLRLAQMELSQCIPEFLPFFVENWTYFPFPPMSSSVAVSRVTHIAFLILEPPRLSCASGSSR